MSETEPPRGETQYVSGSTIELDDQRSVFVGRSADCNAVFLKFKNGDTVTRLCISREAAKALRDLLSDTSGENSVYRWVVLAHDALKQGEDAQT